MPGQEIVLRVIGDAASAVRTFREVRSTLSGFETETKKVSTTVAQAAERNIQSYARQRAKLRDLSQEYTRAAASFKHGSDEQVAAARLAERANQRLAVSQDHAADRARAHGISLGQLAKRAIGLGAVYVGASGLLSLGEKSIDVFERQELAGRRVDQLFGKQGGTIRSWSKTTATSYGEVGAATLTAAADIGKMYETFGVAPAKAASLSRSLVDVAGKVSAIRGIEFENVMKGFQRGLTGAGKGAKLLGIDISEASLKQEAFRLGLTRSTDQGLTPHQKALAATQIILRQTIPDVEAFNKGQADSAIAAKRSHAQITQLEGAIGEGLAPALVSVLTPATKWLATQEHQEQVTKAVRSAVNGMAGAVKTAVPIIRDIWHAADHAADAVGGWKHMIELLIALKLATKIGGWVSALTGSGGFLGAVGQASAATGPKGLYGNLSALASRAWRIGITVAIGWEIGTALGNFLRDKLGIDKAPAEHGMFGTDPIVPGSITLRPTKDSSGKTIKPGDPLYDAIQKQRDDEAAARGRKILEGGRKRADEAKAKNAPPGYHWSPSRQAYVPDTTTTPPPPSDTGGGGGVPSSSSGTRSRGSGKDTTSARRKLIDFALAALGKPYLWGASGPNSFDCSGLVMWAMAEQGISLPHSTYSQVQMGQHVSRANIKPGDVVFTNYGEGGKKGPGHEGLYIGGGMVLQAPHTGDVVKRTALNDFVGGKKYEIRDFVGGTVGTTTTGTRPGAPAQPTMIGSGGMYGFIPSYAAFEKIAREGAAKYAAAFAREITADRQKLATAASGFLDLALQVFDAKTQKMIDHAKATVKSVAGVFDSFSITAGGLTPSEQKLKDMQDARAEADRQARLAEAKASGDAKAIADAEYDITVAGLQKKAEAERAAADKALSEEQKNIEVRRAIMRTKFEDEYGQIMARVQAGTESAGRAQAEILQLLKRYGIDGAEATKLLGDAFGHELLNALRKVIGSLETILNAFRRLQGLPPVRLQIDVARTYVSEGLTDRGTSKGPAASEEHADHKDRGEDLIPLATGGLVGSDVIFQPPAPAAPPAEEPSGPGHHFYNDDEVAALLRTRHGNWPPWQRFPFKRVEQAKKDKERLADDHHDLHFESGWMQALIYMNDHGAGDIEGSIIDGSILENSWGEIWAQSYANARELSPEMKKKLGLTGYLDWKVTVDDIANIRDDKQAIAAAGLTDPLALATGGLVSGVDHGRDSVRTLLRPGELVLNGWQQARLARRLNSTGNAHPTRWLMGQLGIPSSPHRARFAEGGVVRMPATVGYVHPPGGAGSGVIRGGDINLHTTIHADGTFVGDDKRRLAVDLVDEIHGELLRKLQHTSGLRIR